ncbi:MAG: kelch repeat-containing protein, partial [Polyangia bacterium]
MRRLLVVALCLLGACKSHGQLVLGIATDLNVRTQLDHVSLSVTRRGDTQPTVQHDWILPGLPSADFELPGSFALYANPGQSPTFDVMIIGTFAGNEVVTRLASLGIVAKSDRFIRLGLTRSCQTLGCPDSLSCVEGQCVPRFIDPRRMPKYRPALVDHLQCDSGTGFVNTGTHVLLPILGTCDADQTCSEGVCLINPGALPGADPVPFAGGIEELYSTTEAAFFARGPLDAPRYFATATPLDDGRVLVVGGYPSPVLDDSTPAVEGATIYDPALGGLRRIGNPPSAIGGHTATVLADHTVLFVGCAAGESTAFLFDPTTEKFTSLPPPPTARSFHTATALKDGRVLFVGGIDGATLRTTVERYDPATKAFSQLSSSVARAFHQATLLDDGRVLVSGGVTTDGSVLSSYTFYQPATDDFSALVSMKTARMLHSAVKLADQNVLLVGGFARPLSTGSGALADVEVIATGTSQAFTPGGPPLARAAQQVVALPGGKFLFLAGASTAGTMLAPAGGAYLYDQTARAFSLLPDPEAARIGAFAAALATAPADVLIGGGNGVAITTDGGVSDGGGDMSQACNPVGANSNCPSSSVCTIQGMEMFGPRLIAGTPRCITPPTATGMQCTVMQDALGRFDDCQQGSVCLTDVATGLLQCQQVCRTDVDCTG